MSPYRDDKPARLTKLDGTNAWVVASEVVGVCVSGKDQVVVYFRNGEMLTWVVDAPADLLTKFVASINGAP